MASPTLRTGSSGIHVVALQIRLNQHLAPATVLVCDGKFGPRTAAAAVAFQRSKRLSADGIVGPLTWAALDQGRPPLVMVDHTRTKIAQPTPSTCWAASTAVMKRSTVQAVRQQTPANMVASDGGLLNGSDSNDGVQRGRAYGQIHGLRCHAPMSWTTGGLMGLLRRSPVMFDMLWSVGGYTSGLGSPGHMIVVPAAVSDGNPNGGTTVLRVLDPWPPNVGKDSWIDYTTWMQEVPTRTYRLFDKA
jgi:hypothetical protein